MCQDYALPASAREVVYSNIQTGFATSVHLSLPVEMELSIEHITNPQRAFYMFLAANMLGAVVYTECCCWCMLSAAVVAAAAY